MKLEFVSATWAQKLGSRVVKSKGWLIKRRGGEATAGVSSRRKFGEGATSQACTFPPRTGRKLKVAV